MPLTDLLLKGVELMLIGMGSVFVFLTALVLALKGMSLLAARLQPQTAVTASGGGTPPAEDDQLIAVISAAISRYRSTRN